MKKLIFLILISITVLATYFFIIHKDTEDITSQWEKEYNKKRDKHLNNLPSNKQMRIDEVEKYFKGIRTKFGSKTDHYPTNYLFTELQKARNNALRLKSTDTIQWIERGPGNVGGRTRSILVDIRDKSNKTWFAGSATGGLWKTIDEGNSWLNVTNDIPYHAISTIVQSQTSPDVMFIGTGESFVGSLGTTGGGVFKSSNGGESWEQLSATVNENFRYVNRLAIHPQDTNIIIAATTTGIYKTIDSGTTWKEVYSSKGSVEDIKADTSNFNYMYAGVNAFGIVRSTDGGENWEPANEGIFGRNGRFELTISSTNPNRIYASVENFSRGSDVYTSANKGGSWNLIKNNIGDEVDYLGGQAGYDNVISVHPFYEDTVFVGGVNLWRIGITDTVDQGEGLVTKFDTIDTAPFLAFVDFNGVLPGLSTGDLEEGTNLEESDFVDVEIRFGPGKSQKAHRFTVPDFSTSGVPASQYDYIDYVEVPFEVWDITNNQQLMCSFRDQEKDGKFNLYETIGDAYGELGREYIFINSVPYDENNPDANIATQAGRSYKLIYFLWPVLADNGTWNSDELPESYIFIEYSKPEFLKGAVANVSDAYNAFSGKNIYNQFAGKDSTAIPGFHPDHHVLNMIPIDADNNEFWIINGNDGGLGISKDNGVSYQQITNGYMTTQFYGVSKKPFKNEYIGGMQDNGTWQSPISDEAGIETDYVFRLGGDGFETVWHTQEKEWLMASIYNNDIYRSKNGGKSWVSNGGGIEGDGPFITKLTMIPSNPDIVYAVGSEGLWKTENFGNSKWSSVPMPAGWTAEGRSVTSSHRIEYAIANDDILWAGAAISEEFDWKIFVSTDAGESFTTVNYPSEAKDVFVSNIETHPTEPETAYLLYSVFGESKILRTKDLGNTWEDITQFDAVTKKSNNGFPDVACLSLVVFPENTKRIWAGTELGVFESLDDGQTWHILESNLPTVPVFQLFIQDNQVVAATHGRGIWTYQYAEAPNAVEDISTTRKLKIYPNPSTGITNLSVPEDLAGEKYHIMVYDLTGKLVDDFTQTGERNIRLNLSHLRGTYLIKLNTDRYIFTGKILIQ